MHLFKPHLFLIPITLSLVSLVSPAKVIACDRVIIGHDGKDLKVEEYKNVFIDQTSLILWVKLAAIKENAKGKTEYSFEVREVIKGDFSGTSLALDIFRLPPTKVEDQNFHEKKIQHGRMYEQGDCSYSKPYGFVGKSYVLFVGTEFDKMFEQVERSDDAWFKYIKERVKKNAKLK